MLTAIGLTPGGSSTVHICTQTVHRTTQLIWEECWPCPVFASYTLEFALQLRKMQGKPSVRVFFIYMICSSDIFRKGYWECTKGGNSTCFHKGSDLVRPTQPPTQSAQTFCQTHPASYTKCSDLLSDPPSLLHKVSTSSVRPTQPPTQSAQTFCQIHPASYTVSTSSVRPTQPPTQSAQTFCQTHPAFYTKCPHLLSDPLSLP